MPHISLFKVLFNFYLVHLQSPVQFLIHLGATYALSFVAISCFLVIIVRDPGPVDGAKAQKIEDALFGYDNGGSADDEPEDESEGETIGLTEALNKKPHTKTWNGNTERRWCQKVSCFNRTSFAWFLTRLVVLVAETRAVPPLHRMWPMCAEDGSPLPLAC